MRASKISHNETALLFSLFSVDPGDEIAFTEVLHADLRDYISNIQTATYNGFKSRKGGPPRDDVMDFHSLYQVKTYVVLGAFDVAGICLIDDYEIIHRLSGIARQHAQQSFLGLFPEGKPFESQNRLRTRIMEQQFRDEFPLLCISRLKISPLWTAISGFEFVEDLLNACRIQLNGLESRKRNSTSVVLHSQGWSEIVLLVFSRSVCEIADIILQVREKDIYSMFQDELFAETIRTIETSTVGKALRQFHNSGDIKRSHVFGTSDSTIGFNFEIFKGLYKKHSSPQTDKQDAFKEEYDLATKQLGNLCETDKAWLMSGFCCRPGHLSKVHSRVTSFYSDHSPCVLVGRQDYLPLLHQTQDARFTSMAEWIRRAVKLEAAVLEEPLGNPHVFKVRTTVGVLPSEATPAIHPDHIYGLKPLSLPDPEWRDLIGRVKGNIDSIQLPTNLIFDVDRIFSTFDMCVRNFLLMDAFVDMYPFINRMASFLANVKQIGDKVVYRDEDGNITELGFYEFVKQLITAVESFQAAFSNRYLQSYSMSEVTDFSLEFRGSVHQIIAAVSGFSNVLLDLLDKKELRGSVVVVGHEPRIYTRPSFAGCPIFFNYHLLFEPMELAAAYHEVAHYLMMTELNALRYRLRKKSAKSFMPIEQVFCEMFRFHIGFMGDWRLFSKFFWTRFQQVRQTLHDPQEVYKAFVDSAAIFMLATCPEFRQKLRDYARAAQFIDFKSISLRRHKAWRAFKKYSYKMQDAKGFEELVGILLGKSDSASETLWHKIYEQSETIMKKSWQTFREVEDVLSAKLNKLSTHFQISDEFKLPPTYESDIDLARRNLCAGRALMVSSEDLSTQLGAFCFSQKILYAFLAEMFEHIDAESPYIRRDNGEIGCGGRKDLFIDPAGGTFVIGSKFRTTYLNLRIATIISLFDLAQKRKSGFMENRLRVIATASEARDS